MKLFGYKTKPEYGVLVFAYTPFAGNKFNIGSLEKSDISEIYVFRIHNSRRFVFQSELGWWIRIPRFLFK